MENKVWRVTLKYGYIDVRFNFKTAEEACAFLSTAAGSFDKNSSYDKKDLYLNITFVNIDDEGDNNE